MAICLLLGYGWLAVAGAAWVATSRLDSLRDVALHALGLGFIFSMMLGHAPVILPALARVKELHFGWFFYIPVVLLHCVACCTAVPRTRCLQHAARVGAEGNALAIALFAMTMAGAALALACAELVRKFRCGCRTSPSSGSTGR